jgi:hypothetical protein
LRNPILSLAEGDTAYLVGNLSLLDDGSMVPTGSFPLSVWRIQLRYRDAPRVTRIDAPRGVDDFIFPTAATDKNGALHVLWGERAQSGHPEKGESVNGTKVVSIWHSVLRGPHWTTPEKIADFESVEWFQSAISNIIRTPDGGIAIAVPFYEQSRKGGIALLRWKNRKWSVSRTFVAPLEPAYVAAGIGGDGRILIAYIGAAQSKTHDTNSVFTIQSNDGGVHFDPPQLVSLSGLNPAVDPRIATGKHGTMELLWGQSQTQELRADVIRHIHSIDGGRSFDASTELPAKGAQKLAVVTGPCDVTLLVFQAEASGHPTLFLSELKNNSWSIPKPLFSNWFSVSPSITADEKGCIYLAWVGVPADSARVVAHPRMNYSAACSRVNGST